MDKRARVLLLRTASRNFSLDIQPDLLSAGYDLTTIHSLQEYIGSPSRREPQLVLLEIGTLSDLDRAVAVVEWTEHTQPLAPARYILLLASKHLSLGDRATRLAAAEIVTLPQPARNVLFKLELQSRLLRAPAKTNAVEARVRAGFTAQPEEVPGPGKRRVLAIRGPGPQDGSWRQGETAPSGKVRWRWVQAPARAAANSPFSWTAESRSAPRFDEKVSAWVVEGEGDSVACQHGGESLYSASLPAAGHVLPTAGNHTPISSMSARAIAAEAPISSEKIAFAKEHAVPAPGTPFLGDAARAAGERVSVPGAPGGTSAESDGTKIGDGEIDAEGGAVSAPGAGSFDEPARESAFARAKNALAKAGESIRRDEREAAPPASRAPEGGAGEAAFGEETLPAAGETAPTVATGTGEEARISEEANRPADLNSAPPPRAKHRPGKSGAEAAREKNSASSAETPIAMPEPGRLPVAGEEEQLVPEPPGPSAAGGSPATRPEEEGFAPPVFGEAEPLPPLPSLGAPLPTVSSLPAAEASTEANIPAGTLTAGVSIPGGSAGALRAANAEVLMPPRDAVIAGTPVPVSTPASIPGAPGHGLQDEAVLAGSLSPTTASTEVAAGGPSRAKDALTVGQGPGSAVPGAGPLALGAMKPLVAESDELARTVAGRAETSPEARRLLQQRHYELMTLEQLSDNESSWHPAGPYRIYLSAQHRYYGLKQPVNALPLWIYEGELAPEFIDERRAWKFYDRPPVAIATLEELPLPVMEYLYRMCGLVVPPELAARAVNPGVVIVKGGAESWPQARDPRRQEKAAPDTPAPEGAWGRIAAVVKKLFGR